MTLKMLRVTHENVSHLSFSVCHVVPRVGRMVKLNGCHWYLEHFVGALLSWEDLGVVSWTSHEYTQRAQDSRLIPLCSQECDHYSNQQIFLKEPTAKKKKILSISSKKHVWFWMSGTRGFRLSSCSLAHYVWMICLIKAPQYLSCICEINKAFSCHHHCCWKTWQYLTISHEC